MGWIYLGFAGLLEVGFTTALKYAEGFTKLVPSVCFAVAYVGSALLLSRAVATIPLGTAYAVWTGIGAVGAFVVGILLNLAPTTVALQGRYDATARALMGTLAASIPAMLVFLLRGHAWQMDAHMYFFVGMAALSAIGVVAALRGIGRLDHRDRTRDVAHQDGRRVLGADPGVALLRLAGQALHLAEEVAREVEDVDAVALGEDEPAHVRVPAPRLVAEVNSSLEHLAHGNTSGHSGLRSHIRRRIDLPPLAARAGVDIRGFRSS